MGYSGDKKRQYQREWVAKRRADFFSDKSCIKCGSLDSLELDHVDQSKKVSHRIWSWSWDRACEEIKKCQVLCSTCHVEKSVQEKDHAHGEHHGHAKLTEAQVLEIRNDWADGKYEYRVDIARKYNVDKKTVTNILNRKNWTHI